MKQKFLSLIAIFSVLFFSSSCIFTGPSLKGNGNVMEETRKTGDFDEIRVTRGMNVYVTQGENTKVVVKADENLLDAIETNMEGSALKVTANSNIRKATELKVMVTVPDLNVVKTTAGSNLFSENTFETDNIELSASAGSNLKMSVNTENIEVSASAGSNIKLAGTTKSVTGRASAGSNVKAQELVAENCNVKVSSGANFWITVNNDFTGRASSGGNVFYYGNPKTTDIQKSSGGNVIKN